MWYFKNKSLSARILNNFVLIREYRKFKPFKIMDNAIEFFWFPIFVDA